MKERNRKIIKRAIRQLPEFEINRPEIWGRIESKLEIMGTQENKLKKNLPQFNAPTVLWNKIETKPEDRKSVLQRAVKDMPVYKAPAGNWKKIHRVLDRSSEKVLKINYSLIGRIAAAVIIVIAAWLGILKLNNREAENTMPEDNGFAGSDFSLDMGAGIKVIYNLAMCRSNPQICETELFRSLNQQRQEIENEIRNLETILRKNDPQLMKYYYRLVNEQVEIEKRMVRLIIGS
ncbi:MAG: hypothetical protein PVF73_00045 [Bacteroidales bacterium]|jgi:hypothetical protein